MSDFLLEIYSEEIPARMQKDAANNLKNLAFEALSKEKLAIKKEQITTLTSPQRISLIINNLEEAQRIPAAKIIGPKAGAPEKALQGFLRSNNLGIYLNSLGFPLQLNLHNNLALDLLSLTKSILDLARCIVVKLSNNNTSPISYL